MVDRAAEHGVAHEPAADDLGELPGGAALDDRLIALVLDDHSEVAGRRRPTRYRQVTRPRCLGSPYLDFAYSDNIMRQRRVGGSICSAKAI